MDTAYLKRHLGDCLMNVMSEVSEKQPRDPIEYIAHWLYNYQANQKYSEQQRRESVELEKEIKVRNDEKALKQQRKDEARKIAEEEEAKRKLEEELALKANESASKLAPVLEAQEPDEDASQIQAKSQQGETTTAVSSEETPQDLQEEAAEPPAQEHEADEPPATTEQQEVTEAAEESTEGAVPEVEPDA